MALAACGGTGEPLGPCRSKAPLSCPPVNVLPYYPEGRSVLVWDKNRRHRYSKNPITGTASRIFPVINALRVSNGEEIGPENVEEVARKILREVEEISGVDETQLRLIRVRKSRLSGSWSISFEQVYRGFLVYGSGYGVAINRHNRVPSIGGDAYNVVMTTDLEMQPTITSCQVERCLLGNSGDAEIMDSPSLVIYPDAKETGISYIMGWAASVYDGDDSRRVVVDAFTGKILFSASLVRF